MGFKAAIFDMDGTILDTLADLCGSVNAALAWAGLPVRSLEEVRAALGYGAEGLIRRSVPAGTDDDTIARVLAYYKPYYEAHAQIRTAPYPGIPAALSALRAAGVRLAVVSNKPDPATQLLAERFFRGAFDVVLGVRDGMAVKPAPDMPAAAMARLGVTSAEAVYIGDSDVDLATARSAGTACIAVTWGFRDEAFLRAHGAAVIVRDPAELVRCVLA